MEPTSPSVSLATDGRWEGIPLTLEVREGKIERFVISRLECEGTKPGTGAHCETALEGVLVPKVPVEPVGNRFEWTDTYAVVIEGKLLEDGTAGGRLRAIDIANRCCNFDLLWSAEHESRKIEPTETQCTQTQKAAVALGRNTEEGWRPLALEEEITAVPGIQGALMVVVSADLSPTAFEGPLGARIRLDLAPSGAYGEAVAFLNPFVPDPLSSHLRWNDVWVVLFTPDGNPIEPFDNEQLALVKNQKGTLRAEVFAPCGLLGAVDWPVKVTTFAL